MVTILPMRQVRAVVVALLCGILLASWTPAPSKSPATLYVDSGQKTIDRMQQIAHAVKKHDVAALKAMFSPRALDEATDLDAGLNYFLSLFPNGMTWKSWNGPAAEREYKGGKLTEVLLEEFKASAGGREYSVFIAEFTVNDVIDPDNVGLYALGAMPWPKDHDSWLRDQPSGAGVPYYAWARSIHADERDAAGHPGVYVPRQG